MCGHVYNNLWKISRTLDRLLGTEYTPKTYILATQINSKIDKILDHFKRTGITTTTAAGVKSPREVFAESIKLYDILNKIQIRVIGAVSDTIFFTGSGRDVILSGLIILERNT